MSFIVVYVTNKNLEEAKKISSHLLNKKLIACSNIFPIKSMYLWKGNIEDSDEYVALLKAKKSNWKKIKEEIKKLHSYDAPCILKFKVNSNKEYENWLNSESA